MIFPSFSSLLFLQRYTTTTQREEPSLPPSISPLPHILVNPLPLHWEQSTSPVPPQTRHRSPAPRAPVLAGARPKKSRRGGFPPLDRSASSLDAATSSIVKGRELVSEEEEDEAGLPLPEQAKHEQPPVPWHSEQPTGASPRPTAQAAAPAVASTAPPMMASCTVAERRP